MNWFDFGSALFFYALVLLFVYKNRSKFKRYYGVVFLYRMKIALKQMYDFGRKHAFALKIFATIGIIAGLYFMLLLPKMLFDGAVQILEAEDAVSQVAILIPGIEIPGSPFFVPFWYGIISLIILAFVHEFGHAIVAAAEGVKPKSDGFGFFFFIPIFFVELNDKQIMKKKRMQRMRISAAGPAANLLTAFVAILLLNYILAPMIEPLFESNGAKLVSVTDGFPAQQSGLLKDQIITSINNTPVRNTTALVEYLDQVKPGEGVSVGTSEGDSFYITTTTDPMNATQAYVGITFTNNIAKTGVGEKYSLISDLLNILFKLFTWIAFLNIGVGVMNFLPIWLVDGGQIFYNTVLYFIKDEKRAAKFASTVFWFVLFLFLINIFGPFFF
jgi:membrane-associated protease RseP (regulator of RpoE activity)